MRYSVFILLSALIIFPARAFACHPVLKCVQPSGSNYIAYFGFEGGESSVPIGKKNQFSGATGCTASGKDCGQGTKFPNNGPYEADFFGSDSIVKGQSLLPVTFTTSVTWKLSGGSVTATKSSKVCSSPTATPTASATPTRTPSATPTSTRTATPTSTMTATATATRTYTPTWTMTHIPTSTSTTVPTATNTTAPTATNTTVPTFTATPAATSTMTSSPTASPPIESSTPTPASTTTALSTQTPEPTATQETSPTVIYSPTPDPIDPPTEPTPPTTSGTPIVPSESTPAVSLVPDCNGVLGGSSVIDCCGVCGGDGTSCPELCQEVNNAPTKKKLQREVKSITDAILKRIKQELKCKKNRIDAKKRRTETQFQKRQIQSLLNGFENVTRFCATPYCQQVSHLDVTEELKSSVKKLVKIDKLSQRAALNACCKNGKSCGGGKAGPKRSDIMNNAISQFPEVSCG